jgi:hypothetical protein
LWVSLWICTIKYYFQNQQAFSLVHNKKEREKCLKLWCHPQHNII